MSVRMGQKALDKAVAFHKSGYPGRVGFCLGTIRRCFGVPGMQNVSPAGGTAKLAWDRANHRHPFRGSYKAVPAAVPFFWRGGSKGYGHIAISAGDGKCWSTDVKRPGKVDLVTLASITNNWSSFTPLGWTEDLNGVRIAAQLPEVSFQNIQRAATTKKYKNSYPAQTKLVQSALKKQKLLGYYIPGRFGGNTRRAMARWGVFTKANLTRLGNATDLFRVT